MCVLWSRWLQSCASIEIETEFVALRQQQQPHRSRVSRAALARAHVPLGPASSSAAAALRAALHPFLWLGQPATWCSRQQ